LNINTLNNNNNVYDSVVTPPRMADLTLWISMEHVETSNGTDVTDAFDRSRWGNHLTQGTADKRPHLGVVATKYGGRKVLGFDQAGGALERTNTYLQDTDADLASMFGSDVVEPVTDPEFTVALVLNEESGNSGTNKFFTIEENTGAGFDAFRLERVVDSYSTFALYGDADTADFGDQSFTLGTPVTVISVLSQGGAAMEFHQWVGGTANTWDGAGSAAAPANPNQMFIGGVATIVSLAAVKSGGSGAKCNIAEVLVWKGAHTAAERTETLNYLRDRWDCD